MPIALEQQKFEQNVPNQVAPVLFVSMRVQLASDDKKRTRIP